jgi:hypothetical protein
MVNDIFLIMTLSFSIADNSATTTASLGKASSFYSGFPKIAV